MTDEVSIPMDAIMAVMTANGNNGNCNGNDDDEDELEWE